MKQIFMLIIFTTPHFGFAQNVGFGNLRWMDRLPIVAIIGSKFANPCFDSMGVSLFTKKKTTTNRRWIFYGQ